MAPERLGNGLGDSLGLSLTYESQKIVNSQAFVIAPKDKEVLRGLAFRVAELASRPVEAEKKKLWYAHNDLKPTRPLIFCDPENGWYEIIPGNTLQCEGSIARIWEFKLRKEIFWGERMGDDRVIVSCFNVQYVFTQHGRGMEQTVVGGENNGAYTWEPALKDYADLSKLRFSRFEVDRAKTDQLLQLAADTFDGILKIRLEGCWWWSFGMTTDLINLIGSDQSKDFRIDITEGKRTLIALHALTNSPNARRLLEILEMRTADSALLEEAVALMRDAGSIEYARTYARAIIDEAKTKLERALAPSKARDLLLSMADFFIKRDE